MARKNGPAIKYVFFCVNGIKKTIVNNQNIFLVFLTVFTRGERSGFTSHCENQPYGIKVPAQF